MRILWVEEVILKQKKSTKMLASMYYQGGKAVISLARTKIHKFTKDHCKMVPIG